MSAASGEYVEALCIDFTRLINHRVKNKGVAFVLVMTNGATPDGMELPEEPEVCYQSFGSNMNKANTLEVLRDMADLMENEEPV